MPVLSASHVLPSLLESTKSQIYAFAHALLDKWRNACWQPMHWFTARFGIIPQSDKFQFLETLKMEGMALIDRYLINPITSFLFFSSMFGLEGTLEWPCPTSHRFRHNSFCIKTWMIRALFILAHSSPKRSSPSGRSAISNPIIIWRWTR